jgi:adenylate cyclase
VEVFEPVTDFPAEAVARLNAAYARFDAGDGSAIVEIRDIAADFPDDVALQNLLRRLESVGPGGVFTLS